MSVKIAFITGHEFGLSALNGLLSSAEFLSGGIDLCLLVTLDQTKKNRTVGYCDFTGFAKKKGIRHIVTEKANSIQVIDELKTSKPDYLLVIAWSELVSSEILDIPKVVHGSKFRHSNAHGCIGMHPTLLPQGRGRAPIPWTILKGLKKTGVTVFLLEEAADVGSIVLQDEILVEEMETAATLFAKVAECHYRLGLALSPLLASQQLSWHPQVEANATVWRKRRPEDGLLDFHASNIDIGKLVRALTKPYPGAFFVYKDRRVVVNAATLSPISHHHQVGTIIGVTPSGMPIIATKEGIIECTAIETKTETPTFFVGAHVEGQSA